LEIVRYGVLNALTPQPKASNFTQTYYTYLFLLSFFPSSSRFTLKLQEKMHRVQFDWHLYQEGWWYRGKQWDRTEKKLL
jgi:hypothetical protein